MDFPDTDLEIIVHVFLGADPNDDSGTWPAPTDLSSRVLKSPVRITAGRGQGQKSAPASSATLQLDNTDGHLTPLNPASPYYGTWDLGVPMLLGVDVGGGPVSLMRGYMADIKPTFVPGTGGVNWSTVTVTLGGVLRRLGQGRVPKSALRRTLTGQAITAPVYYWPLEADPLVGGFKAMIGGQTLRVVGDAGYVTETDGSFGSAGGVRFECYAPDGGAPDLAGRFGTVGLAGLGSTKVSLAMVFRGEFAPTPTTTSWRLPGLVLEGGTVGSLDVLIYADTASNVPGTNFGIDVTLDGSSQLVNNFATAPSPFDRLWHSLLVTVEQDGADVVASAWLDGVAFANTLTGGAGKTLGEPVALTPARPWNVSFGTDAYNNVGSAVSIAHLAIWGDVTPLDPYDASTGYTGEQAHNRFSRVCAEEGIPFSTSATTSRPVGPQPVGDVLAVQRDLETVDHGILYELLDDWGLGYRALSQRYNLTPSMTIDLATYRVTSGESADVLTPVRNDARLRNQWTTSRPGGAEVTVRDAASIAKRGLYDDSAEVNVVSDDDVLSDASWRLHMSTFDGLRYATLPIDLAANNGGTDGSDDLLSDWLVLALGDRIDRTDHPSPEHPPDTVSLEVEGYTATIEPRRWRADVVAEPYGPWDVGKIGGPGRLQVPAGTTVAEDLDATETGVTVSAAVFSTAAVPYDVVVGGERMTVTSVSGSTLTVTRSVNGVVKTHSNGAEIHVVSPLRVALGGE